MRFFPAREFHHVHRPERPYSCRHAHLGPDPAALVPDELDRLGVGHPPAARGDDGVRKHLREGGALGASWIGERWRAGIDRGTAILALALVQSGTVAAAFAVMVNAWLTPMPVKVTGRENIDPRQSYVVVANHQSLYDVFVLYGFLGIDFKWVMKQEMRSVPGLGIGCEKVGHIFVDRSNRQAALASIKAAESKIRNGTSVVFFPEGTRSRDGALRPFKKGAFRFALDLNLPILPVTIVGTREILPPDTVDLLPGKARLIIDEPIRVDGLDGKDIPRLMEQVRSVFEDRRSS